ncbi:MAG: ester cyclase [Candidatus Aminicenantes bacterium]|nr:MAG: ester cyclase [Candidatus Aminicenantes bacterium]
MKKIFMIFPIVILLCFFSGCQDKESMNAQAEIEEQNIELIRNFFAAIDKGNVGIYEEIFAPDAAFYSPSGISEPLFQDHEIETKKTYSQVFPDLVHTIEEIIAKGDKVIVRTIARGTHLGDHAGIPVTGNKIEWSAIRIFQIDNGKIVRMWEETDLLGLFLQVGMELKPKKAEK